MAPPVDGDDGPFADVLAANAGYAAAFELRGLPSPAARGLAVVTCMDSRIEPLRMLGISPGDAKILRNAGGRVTDDVLRTLVVATHFLGVQRVMVVVHTRCKMAEVDDDEIHADLAARGLNSRSLSFGAGLDQERCATTSRRSAPGRSCQRT
jgi:carbonic anhydrase